MVSIWGSKQYHILATGREGSDMDRCGHVVVPWEHWVCAQCLQDYPYAVWLIKLKCFQPRHSGHHYPYQKVLVSIEPNTMKLVKMRPPPPQAQCLTKSSGSVQLCKSYPHCHGGSCPFPHSEVEHHTWNFIRTLFKGMEICPHVVLKYYSMNYNM